VSEEGARTRGLRNDQVAGLALMALALFTGLQARSYPLGTLAEPGPAYLPLILAVLLGAFGALVAVRGGASPVFGWRFFAEAPKAMAILAGLAFAALAMERLGYRVTIAALLVYYLGVLERRHWLLTLILAAVVALGTFQLFAVTMRVPLPRGPGGL
jgi:putative tricarboxylic transport membrane protein